MSRFHVLGFVAGAALVLVGQTAHAQSATIDAAHFGIYENSGQVSHVADSDPNLPRYDVGQPFTNIECRDYFTFSLVGVNFTVTGATLRIFSPNTPNADPAPQTNTLNIFALSTPLATVTDSPGGVGATYGAIFT